MRKGLARNAYRGMPAIADRGKAGFWKREKKAIFGSFLSAGEVEPARTVEMMNFGPHTHSWFQISCAYLSISAQIQP